MSLTGIDAKRVQQLDAIDAIDDLKAVGKAVAATVDLSAFGDLTRQ